MPPSRHPVPPRLLTDLRALPRPFWILFTGCLINRFGTFVWPFLTIYLTRHGHSITAAASAVSSWSGGHLLGALLGGWLSDHLGRRNTIVLGTALAAVFTMLLYSASALPAVMACAALAGVANGIYVPANAALLTDVVPPELRIRGFSALRLAGNAGFAFGAAFGGWLASGSFFALFAGDALTTLAYSMVALFALPHGLRRQTREAPWAAAVRHLRGDRAFHTLFFASICSALIFSQFGSTLSLFITRGNFPLANLAPEAVYGLLIGWNGVLVVLCELPLTSWTQRFEPRRAMAAGYLLLGGGFALNAVAQSTAAVAVAITVFTLGEMISIPVSGALLAQLAPPAMRGRYLGVQSLAGTSAGIVGPLAGAALLDRAPLGLWLGCGGLGLLGAAAIWRLPVTPSITDLDQDCAASESLAECSSMHES